MSIAPIPAFNPIPAVTGTAPTAAPKATGTSFGDAVSGALENLSDAHQQVDKLAVEAATGDLTAIHDFTIAATEAQLLTELTVEVRNKAIEAFNDIMRMQV